MWKARSCIHQGAITGTDIDPPFGTAVRVPGTTLVAVPAGNGTSVACVLTIRYNTGIPSIYGTTLEMVCPRYLVTSSVRGTTADRSLSNSLNGRGDNAAQVFNRYE